MEHVGRIASSGFHRANSESLRSVTALDISGREGAHCVLPLEERSRSVLATRATARRVATKGDDRRSGRPDVRAVRWASRPIPRRLSRRLPPLVAGVTGAESQCGGRVLGRRGGSFDGFELEPSVTP